MSAGAPVRVADVLARGLAAQGIRHVFLVTGGAAMHLNDAIGRCEGLEWVACHHEQACAMAAASYYRMSGRLAAVNVTAGPGGTNAITGVFGAWTDSLGMVVLSGQVKWETLVRSTDLPLRQLGDQEVDITRLVAPITKYAVMSTEPEDCLYHLERAIHLARSGRPGPVWVDVPMNVQGALVDEARLRRYDPAEDRPAYGSDVTVAAGEILDRLARASRPVILAGSGVRIAGAAERFLALADRLRIPVTTAFNAHDLVPGDHPLYAGRPGTVGDRAGNFAVQNADFLLVLGCRLNIRQIGYAWSSFARAAFVAMVDADAAELAKPTLHVDLPVHADLAELIDALFALPAPARTAEHERYLAWCLERRERYPVVLPEYRAATDGINPYVFVEALFDELPEGAVVVTGDGTACVCTFQAARIKRGQRLYSDSGSAPMGFDLPGAIGASFAAGGERPIVCLAGDGSLQMNLQELATVAAHRLPIKLFVLNNQGYHSIRQTQRAYFPDNLVGCGRESGLAFPDLALLAAAYGIPYRRAGSHAELGLVRETLAAAGPQMCEVILDLSQPFAPKPASRRLPDGRMVSSPLEDQAPFLSREELLENLLIPPLSE